MEFDFNQTDYIKEMHKITNDISVVFKPYSELYIKFNKNEIGEIELRKSFRNMLLELSYDEQQNMNERHKMLSTSNCWCIDYHTGNIIHEELIKIWYPDGY